MVYTDDLIEALGIDPIAETHEYRTSNGLLMLRGPEIPNLGKWNMHFRSPDRTPDCWKQHRSQLTAASLPSRCLTTT